MTQMLAEGIFDLMLSHLSLDSRLANSGERRELAKRMVGALEKRRGEIVSEVTTSPLPSFPKNISP